MGESASEANLAKWAERIRNLLAKADSTEFEEEAAAFRAKAEELMRTYRIEEEQLIAEDQFSILPISREIKVSSSSGKFLNVHWSMWFWTAEHTGCRTEYKFVGGDLYAVVVGYASDIRYAEALYNSAWLTLISKLEPKVNPKLSDEENVYHLRNSGMTRRQIAKLLWDLDTHAVHARVGKMYESACRDRGEDPVVSGRGISVETYREVYGRSFSERYTARLKEARDAVDSVTGGLTLHGRKERVDEAFYVLYPSRRPETQEQKEARLAAEAEAAKKQAKKGTVEKKAKPITKAQRERIHRLYYSSAAQAGRSAGVDAANSVELTRGHTKAQRIEDAPGGIAGELGN